MRRRRATEEQEQIIRHHANMVYRMALAYVRNKPDADDVFQDVFFRYLRKNPKFKSEEYARRWFLKVTANCSKSLLNSAWRKHTEPLEDEPFASSEENRLHEALAELPPHYRDVIHLYYFEGYKTEEIADEIKLTGIGRKNGVLHIQTYISDWNGNSSISFWLEDDEGNILEEYSVNRKEKGNGLGKKTTENCYTEHMIDVLPEELSKYTLHAEWRTGGEIIEGEWRVKFPLKRSE